jgi:hypothetical protein
MKRWVIMAVACSFVACGGTDDGTGGGGTADGGGLGDAHLQTACVLDSDCDDGKMCHTPHCVGGTCQYQEMACSGGDDCNDAACVEGTGCKITAKPDKGVCMANGMPGTCMGGACLPLPTCYDTSSSFNSVACDSSPSSDSTDPSTSTSSPTTVIDTYACATMETGPEVAYQFVPATEGDVTFSLKAKTPAVDGGTEPDLDLIVLDGSCTTSAACMNAQRSGGGYDGITAGSGQERVSFHALVGHTYYVVIDGKAGAKGDYTLTVDSCGACNATLAPALACNLSMPVSGDTSKGQSKLSMYTCTQGTSTAMVSAPGNELPFLFSTSAPTDVHATAKVVNASGPVTLLALPTTSGVCDPMSCKGSATSSAGTAQLSFTASPDFSDNVKYWVVVDTAASSDATFGLQLACDPYCHYNFDNVDCSTKTAPSGANNAQTGSTNDVSAWGPAGGPACGGMTNLTGSEYVYKFHKTATTNLPKYRFTLAATTDNKHLGLVILDAGKTDPSTTCTPTLGCANTKAVTVAASGSTLASTGTYVSAGPNSSDGGTTGKTAVVDLTTGTTGEHYYWIVVDGVNGDTSDFALSLDSGCP